MPSYRLRRYPANKRAVRNVFRDDRASAHERSIADGNTISDNDVTGKPCAAAQRNRPTLTSRNH